MDDIRVSGEPEEDVSITGFTGNPLKLGVLLGAIGVVCRIFIVSGALGKVQDYADNTDNKVDNYIVKLLTVAIKDGAKL